MTQLDTLTDQATALGLPPPTPRQRQLAAKVLKAMEYQPVEKTVFVDKPDRAVVVRFGTAAAHVDVYCNRDGTYHAMARDSDTYAKDYGPALDKWLKNTLRDVQWEINTHEHDETPDT